MKNSRGCDSYSQSMELFKVQLWILTILHKLLFISVHIALSLGP